MPRAKEPIREILVEVEGSKRPVRRYLAVVDVPRAKPRRQVKGTFDKRADAVGFVTAIRAGTATSVAEYIAHRDGHLPSPEESAPAVVFRHVSGPWLEVKKRTVRPVTATAYAGAVAIWDALLGDKPVTEVTKADIEGLVSTYQDAGRSAARVAYLLMVVRGILNEAVEEGHVTRNVALRVKARGKAPEERGAMPDSDMRTLRRHVAAEPLEAIWLLSMSGLRRSEVLGLRWSDVNLDARTISITRGRVQTGGSKQIHEGPTKTKRGTRTLPIPSDLLAALRRLRSEQLDDYGLGQVRDGYLGVDPYGLPIRPEWYSDEWRRVCARAGVEAVTLHAARHSSVTRMRDLGVPDHVVAEFHGHDEVVMRRTYSHASAEGLSAAGDALFADLAAGDSAGM